MRYTNLLKSCVHDVAETTEVIPHLNDQALVSEKLETLDQKICNLERVFGYKRVDHVLKGGHVDKKQDLVEQGEDSYGIKLSFQYEEALKRRLDEKTKPNNIAKKIQEKKMGTFCDDFKPSQPLNNIPLTSQFRIVPAK